MHSSWKVAVHEYSLGAGEEAIEAGGPSGKATSVTVLLSQALRSDDHQLLEKCFAMSNDRVVKSSVQQLAPQDAARLVQVAVQRLQSSPRRGKQIATWLRALLLYHTAYLISAPGLPPYPCIFTSILNPNCYVSSGCTIWPLHSHLLLCFPYNVSMQCALCTVCQVCKCLSVTA